MAQRTIPVVILQGSPAERGRQHGSRFAAEIKSAVSRIRGSHSASSFEAARRRAEATWPLVSQAAADVSEEINGIAIGASLHPTDILLLIGFEFFQEAAPTGCSAVALSARAGSIVAQNWDAPEGAIDELVVFFHFGKDGFEHAVIASIGGLGWVGCNGEGLAFVNNDLLLKGTAEGLPSQIIRRLILKQADVASAIRELHRLKHMAGRSYVLGDRAGNVAAVEVAAGQTQVVTQTSPIFHTNHPIHPAIASDSDEAALQQIYPSSRARFGALGLHGRQSHDVQSVMQLLRNEDGAPDAICKAASAAEPTLTAFSVIFDCAGGTFHLCAGAPAHGEFIAFSLPSK